MQHSGSFIETFTLLGDFLGQYAAENSSPPEGIRELNEQHLESFREVIETEHTFNPWFTGENIRKALKGISLMLRKDTLKQWFGMYGPSFRSSGKSGTVGLILAGNIPLVGFHDLLCVLAAGHRALVKPSSKDDRLLKGVADVLFTLAPSYLERLTFTDDTLGKTDAVIATGSNNSARYFEYYFRQIPHIIRKNRNGVGIVTGRETPSQLDGFGTDIFTYFGLGCRNVTKLYLPEDYDPVRLLRRWEGYTGLGQHHKYANNVDYYRTIYLMNRIPILDNGVLLMKEDEAIASPVGVVYYERYSEIDSLQKELQSRESEIQCCVTIEPRWKGALKPGTTQEPGPWDYADGIDTMKFLLNLD